MKKKTRKAASKGRGNPAPTGGKDRNKKTKKGAQPCAPMGREDKGQGMGRKKGGPSTAGRTPSAQDGGLAGMGRTRGGQPGNSNARTHGLWAKYQQLVTEEEKDLNAGPEQRRDILDRVIKVLFMDFCEAEDTETRCRISNALCIAVTAANGCDRTLAIVTGKLSPLQQAIEELLAEEDPDDYSTVEQSTFTGDRGENVDETEPGEDAGDEDEVEVGSAGEGRTVLEGDRRAMKDVHRGAGGADARRPTMKGGASDGTQGRGSD